MKPNRTKRQLAFDKSGQTLVTLLVFSMVAMLVASTAVVIVINSALATNSTLLGTQALQIAESGAENSLLRLLRDPHYAGETLSVGEGTATSVVTGTTPKTMTITGNINGFQRKVIVIVTYTDTMTIQSWKESF